MNKNWINKKFLYTLCVNKNFMNYLKDFEYWDKVQYSQSKAFVCWNCGEKVASKEWFFILENKEGWFPNMVGWIYICPHCQWPNCYSSKGEWLPWKPFGKEVENLPENIHILYNEARQCMKNQCYTATLLLCRKILMHICIEEWAEEGKNFTFYVDFLMKNGYLPTQKNNWTDKIRTSGNDMNHKNIIADKENAENILKFIQMILQLLYEFPNT